jgi:hypothetical protein
MITETNFIDFYKMKNKIFTSEFYNEKVYEKDIDNNDIQILKKLEYSQIKISEYIYFKVYIQSILNINLDTCVYLYRMFSIDNNDFEYFRNRLIECISNYEFDKIQELEDDFLNYFNNLETVYDF